MGRVSDHLKGFHKSAMEQCNTVSKCVGKLAGMAKASKSQLKDDDEDGIWGTLQKISDVFAAGATYHKAAMEECSKATGDEFSKGASDDLVKRIAALENTVIPTNVHAVIPNRPGITAVPRAGQREIPARPEVPIQFEHLVRVEE
ncbi:MAG TPA: hypothetical protein VK709_06365 [Candidatus Saccharimonadales bacterium]|jgi:hypothetical protein|nr:hypothetical protein [Candidatus Saccharimonadales bacterium]